MLRQLYSGLVLAFPLWATTNLGHPGAINYIEGQVTLNGQPLTTQSVGSSDLQSGQVLETAHGKAEILLTPGVFVRVGDSSAIRMDNPGLTDTRVSVLRGEALVEVNVLYKENNIRVNDGGNTVSLLKKGLYDFNGTQPRIEVYDGEAQVQEGDSQVTVKKGKELPLTVPAIKTAKFDRGSHDDLYNWSSVRSQYLAEASAESASTYVVAGGGGPWLGSGWYWNPWFGMYSFIPGDGFLYSPFGWGFYSPGYIGYSPYYSGGYYRNIGGVVRGSGVAVPAARGGVSANVRFSGLAAHSFSGGGGRMGGGGRGR